MSDFYDLSTVASTAGGTFTGLGNLVSVSNSGDIAFVGSTGSGVFGDSGLYVEKAGTTTVVNINPMFSSDPSRSFGQGAAINDEDLVTARDQVASSPSQFLIRQWNAAQLNSNVILSHIPTTTTGSPDSQYSGLQDFTDVNDNGDMAFVALSSDGTDRSVEFVSASDAGLDTYQTIEQMPGGTLPTPRPQLTDTGQVLYYSTADNAIKLVDLSSHQVTVIAQVGVGGFTSLGSTPGVSFDGQVVVFEGNKGNGSGIFAAYFSKGKEQIVRIAGAGLDNFVAFDPTQAVQVGGGSIGPDDRGVTIAFVGTNQSEGTGLYTARLSFFGAMPDIYNPAAVVSTLVSGIEPVALDLDTLPDGKTIDQVNFGFGIDEIDRGQLTFWVQTVDGTQEIIQAEPNQVVWINFNPADGASSVWRDRT